MNVDTIMYIYMYMYWDTCKFVQTFDNLCVFVYGIS